MGISVPITPGGETLTPARGTGAGQSAWGSGEGTPGPRALRGRETDGLQRPGSGSITPVTISRRRSQQRLLE